MRRLCSEGVPGKLVPLGNGNTFSQSEDISQGSLAFHLKIVIL